MEKRPVTTEHQKERTRATVLLMDMNAICEGAQINRATGWRWLKDGILPPPTIKVGRVVRWSVESIEKWASEGVRA